MEKYNKKKSTSYNLIILILIFTIFGFIFGGMIAINDSINILQSFSYYYFLNTNLPYKIQQLLSMMVSFSLTSYLNFIQI